MRNAALALLLGFATVASPERQPIFSALGLTPAEIASVDAGRPVAKVLSWGTPSEVYVFGAVHINGSSDSYVDSARDIKRLAALPGYLGAGELRSDSTVSELASLAFDLDDVRALRSCREGDCVVQLPAESIAWLRTQVDWSRPDATEIVSARARSGVLELLRAYQLGGNRALGEYRDKQRPADIAAEFESMLLRASVLPDVMPELRSYLLDYPKATLPNAESYFYWEKVNFGLKPTMRVNHGVIHHGRIDERNVAVVAIKQLYASHYFHTALDVSVCIDDVRPAPSRGFYLLTLKGSQQEGLTGVRGSMLRKIATDKTRKSLESALLSIKKAVENTRAQGG